MQIQPISGFSELSPEKFLSFDAMKHSIKQSYSVCGFFPIETPVCERKETLLSKGGDDNEIYGVHRLNGEKEDGELALRFDLTVPLARFVAMNEGNLKFPFKRQHIDRVWRGERAQTGRAREFYQADVDIIGREKLPLFADVECIFTVYSALKNLDFGDFIIHINNKKILLGFLDAIGVPQESTVKVISIIDKKEKLKIAGKSMTPLLQELISEAQVQSILSFIQIETKSFEEKIQFFASYSQATLQEGIEELEQVYRQLLSLGVEQKNIVFDNTIARGLNYYTGTLLETFLIDAKEYGSIASGGRYENLVGNFSKTQFPGVGVSIGLTRLFQILDKLGKIDISKFTFTKVLILNFDAELEEVNLVTLAKLRNAGIASEIYLDKDTKMKKQLEYADAKKIPFVLISGGDELKKRKCIIKNMHSGIQEEVIYDDIVPYFQKVIFG